jgi:Arf/Sar family protein
MRKYNFIYNILNKNKMGFVISKIYDKFFTKKLELCLLGLENTGKTTFVDTLMGKPKKSMPTIGLNVKQVKKGSKKKIG